MMFPIVGVNACVLGLAAWITASRVFSISDRFLREGRMETSGRNLTYTRRMMKALKPLKIHFGGNFVDPCTPLVISDFSMRQTLTLLLCT